MKKLIQRLNYMQESMYFRCNISGRIAVLKAQIHQFRSSLANIVDPYSDESHPHIFLQLIRAFDRFVHFYTERFGAWRKRKIAQFREWLYERIRPEPLSLGEQIEHLIGRLIRNKNWPALVKMATQKTNFDLPIDRNFNPFSKNNELDLLVHPEEKTE